MLETYEFLKKHILNNKKYVALINIEGFGCIYQLFYEMNLNNGKIRKIQQSGVNRADGFNFYTLYFEDSDYYSINNDFSHVIITNPFSLHCVDIFWSILLYSSDKNIQLKAMRFFCELYYRTDESMFSRQEYVDEFLENIKSRLRIEILEDPSNVYQLV